MKKVISIVVAIALALSCCVVAFASSTTTTREQLFGYVIAMVGDQEYVATLLAGKELYDPSMDLSETVDSEYIANVLIACYDDGCLAADGAHSIVDTYLFEGDQTITVDQMNEIDDAIDQFVAEKEAANQSGDDSGEGDDSSGGIDLGGITDTIKNIFSNLGNFDLGSFGEGAKSGLGQLIDGLSGAGLPDLSSITGLLGGLGGGGDILGTIMGLLGLGGDDSGSSTPSTPVTPSTPGTSTNTNTAVIPKTADTAPIAAVATLAVVAGVAFVLTRKKNEE